MTNTIDLGQIGSGEDFMQVVILEAWCVYGPNRVSSAHVKFAFGPFVTSDGAELWLREQGFECDGLFSWRIQTDTRRTLVINGELHEFNIITADIVTHATGITLR